VAMGLVFAGALTVLEAAGVNALQLVTTLVALGFLLFTKVGPYPLMIAAAAGFAALQFV
jgi:chromate transporter